MAIATTNTNPYVGDPTVPRKVTPTGVVLDPIQAQGPDTAPASPPVPASTPRPMAAAQTPPGGPGASAISQLPDGAGGAVTVPPPSMAPGGGFQIPSAPNINQIPNAGATIPPTGPAPVTSSAPGSVPGASTFNAGQNLIQTQIDPAASPRLLGAQNMSDAALAKVENGPDRAQLGQQYYDTFAQRAQNQFGHALTDATNQAAAHGQIGSGMLTNRYGDLTQQFNLDNTTAASDYATRALEGTIGDRLNNLNAARGAENSIYGQEANARNEVRGERGYQQSLAEQAIAQRIAQNQMEQGQQQQNFGDAATLYGLGNANNPTGAYQDAATLASSEAGSNSADVAALLRLFAQNRNPLPQGSY
jgi:hypothetical protein